MANPTLLSRLLCADADKNTIPDTDAGTAGVFSQQYGWQAINSLPLSAGGKAVQRQDFNGVFNLLGGIAFYAQKGYTFEWDINQDYYANCVVTDPLDGNKYNAKNDVAKGGSNPSLDPTNWERFADTSAMLTREVTPAFNTRDVITTSGTYTAPVTGWYKITAKGGGGSGGSGVPSSGTQYGGGGGGEGGTTIAYEYMNANDSATVVIGAGGASTTTQANGNNGGDSSVTVNTNTYTGGGGKGGKVYRAGGLGGIGTVYGCAGSQGSVFFNANIGAGSGGGAGGGVYNDAGYDSSIMDGKQGGGGAGATYGNTVNTSGAGGDGFVWFEYFASI